MLKCWRLLKCQRLLKQRPLNLPVEVVVALKATSDGSVRGMGLGQSGWLGPTEEKDSSPSCLKKWSNERVAKELQNSVRIK